MKDGSRQPADRRRNSVATFFLIAGYWLLAAGVTRAQSPSPPQVREVGFEQKLDAALPLDLAFRDDRNQPVQLRDYFGNKPVLLTLNYFHCQNLCPLVLSDFTQALSRVPFDIGNQFNVVTVSIDPRETPVLAAVEKQTFVGLYARSGAGQGWHFLTGDEDSIQQLAQAVGFHYKYDAAKDEYSHPEGVIVLTPQGRIARYLYGLDNPARDIRLALVEAAANKIGTPLDQVFLLCYHYDVVNGRYSAFANGFVQVGALGVMLCLGGFLLVMWRREVGR